MASISPVRVSLFSSYWFGAFLLNELMEGPNSESVEVVGIVTDDPTSQHCNAEKRFWSHIKPSSRNASEMKLRAERYSIDLYAGRLCDGAFHSRFMESWAPELLLVLGFGQRVPETLFAYPSLGSFNFHPGRVNCWPSSEGVAPYDDLIERKERHFSVHCHWITADIDRGPERLESEPIVIPHDAGFMDLLKLTCPAAALLMRQLLGEVIEQKHQQGEDLSKQKRA